MNAQGYSSASASSSKARGAAGGTVTVGRTLARNPSYKVRSAAVRPKPRSPTEPRAQRVKRTRHTYACRSVVSNPAGAHGGEQADCRRALGGLADGRGAAGHTQQPAS